MADYQFCSKNDEHCFTNLPLITVLLTWFRDNSDFFMDINPAILVYMGFTCIMGWILLNIFFRILRSMIRPLLCIAGIWIVLYTKQSSHSENPVDFIFNVFGNILLIISKIFEILCRIFFGNEIEVDL